MVLHELPQALVESRQGFSRYQGATAGGGYGQSEG